MPQRFVHNPGNLVPVLITADALRYLHHCAKEMAVVYEKQAAYSPVEIQSAYLHMAEKYKALAQEVQLAKETTPAAGRMGDVPVQEVVIGAGLYTARLTDLRADIAELDRRIHEPGSPDKPAARRFPS